MIRQQAGHSLYLIRANVSTTTFISLTKSLVCYLHVPIYTPFRLQFYMNSHNLLAYKLQRRVQHTACTITLSSKSQMSRPPRNSLTGLIQKTSIKFWMLSKNATVPSLKYLVSATHGQSNRLSVKQISCLDSRVTQNPFMMRLFRQRSTVKLANIVTFLGQRITYDCKKEFGTIVFLIRGSNTTCRYQSVSHVQNF